MMRWTLALALVAFAWGCAPEPFVCPTVAAAAETFPTGPGFEDQRALAALVETVPGFGGTYVMRDQVHLAVLLVEPSQALADQARDALVEIYGERPWRNNPATPQKTTYDFAQLWRYELRSRGVFVIEDMQTLGIDHFTGVVHYGVVSEDAKACVESNLLALEIPEDAFRVEVEGPLVEN
jgi:hypothetical protein